MKIARENYISIQGWMVTDLNLKGNELLIYACIYGFSQTDGQTFRGSLKYLAEWTNSTKQGVMKCLKSLVEKGYIIKKETIINGVKFCEYTAVEQNLRVVNKVEQGSKQSCIGGIKQSLPNNINKDNIVNNIKENKEKELTEEFNQLWELYPNKKGKANALKSYLKACKNGSIYEQVKQGIENYKAEIKAKGTPIEYIKHGSTWFNQQCWNDEYETKPQYSQQKEDTSFSIELAEQKAQAFLRGEIDICGKNDSK